MPRLSNRSRIKWMARLEDLPKLTAAAAAKSLQSCRTLWLRRSWGSPGKNTGVGCHFLLCPNSREWQFRLIQFNKCGLDHAM